MGDILLINGEYIGVNNPPTNFLGHPSSGIIRHYKDPRLTNQYNYGIWGGMGDGMLHSYIGIIDD